MYFFIALGYFIVSLHFYNVSHFETLFFHRNLGSSLILSQTFGPYVPVLSAMSGSAFSRVSDQSLSQA